MPLVRLEPTIPALKRAKTFHALGRETTVIGVLSAYGLEFSLAAVEV
jgi:hypothetical protein